jgi:hypothetical protein
MINENIRHSASYELSDIQLARCIDALRDLLQDSKFLLHNQHAQDAVNKLYQVSISDRFQIYVWSTDSLTFTVTGDICRYLWSVRFVLVCFNWFGKYRIFDFFKEQPHVNAWLILNVWHCLLLQIAKNTQHFYVNSWNVNCKV